MSGVYILVIHKYVYIYIHESSYSICVIYNQFIFDIFESKRLTLKITLK